MVSDENGNIASISRKDIIRAYFKYLIHTAEQQHKCKYKNIHITSPIKQKRQFLEMYKEVLNDYNVEINNALDEGIAVLYNSISNQIEKNNFRYEEEYKALIIDCGGGTTDLTNCSYYIKQDPITYELNITTTYANGETNYGGNNITYRIFQYLKIVFSKYYRKEDIIRIDEIFDSEISNIYRYIDTYGHKTLYEPLEKLYKESEAIIPTRFNDYINNSTNEYMKVRSNFYFLWNLAEKIKIDFYKGVSVRQTDFHIKGIKSNEKDSKIIPEESWRINVYDQKNILKLNTEIPQIIITKEEINTLIKGDIYYVIKKFIEPIYLDGQLDDINFIKLTGQTCKIDIFRDALKEFIPGRIIQSAKKEKNVQDFKLICLEGAIKYQNAKRIGLISPTIINKAPVIPYKLIALNHMGKEITMISNLEKINRSYGFVSRNINTEDVELTLLDGDNNILHKYYLYTNIKRFKKTTYTEIKEHYGDKILQDDVDSIKDGEIKIFTFAFEDKWGFYVLPLARKEGVLLMGERKYFPFENEEWEINFFDGRK
ncbi:acetate and sugar kinases/Hsc70/actin family protein [Defluviitalea phaphyphila]|uniref:hypothetical protein n=1 Tax=Defluviitalea phaphyphila TaxID=1473580 RepID=UPI000731BB0A|nr:hypothetical protein [Defluviitalea phaphyphila]